MRGNWNKVNRAIHGALSQVTLADMAVVVLPFAPPATEKTTEPGTTDFGRIN
jgi:DNA-binding IscR family transcriptional regulator